MFNRRLLIANSGGIPAVVTINFYLKCLDYQPGVIDLPVTFKISDFNNAYKSASSRLIKKDFPEVRRKLWKEMFWLRSYCLLTTGGAPIETIRKYIENQGR